MDAPEPAPPDAPPTAPASRAARAGANALAAAISILLTLAAVEGAARRLLRQSDERVSTQYPEAAPGRAGRHRSGAKARAGQAEYVNSPRALRDVEQARAAARGESRIL